MNEMVQIENARQGDIQAFNELIERYQHLIFNVAYRILGDAEAADDAAQQTFIAAYRNINRFRGTAFRPWILRILTNACYDELRRRKSRRSTSLEEMYEESNDGDGPWLFDPGEGPEAYAQRRELSETIQRGLDGLPADQRMVLVLCDVYGMSYEEAAESVGTNIGTVKSRLSRARGRMRDFLRPAKEPVLRSGRLSLAGAIA